MTVIITTERLILRTWQVEDSEAYLQYPTTHVLYVLWKK